MRVGDPEDNTWQKFGVITLVGGWGKEPCDVLRELLADLQPLVSRSGTQHSSYAFIAE